MSIASWLTLSRLCLLPLAVLSVLAGWPNGWLIAAVVTALAALTDVFDGYLARRTGHVSSLGANLDLISDKVFVLGMLALLVWTRMIPLSALIVVIMREVVVSLVRFVRFHGQSPLPDFWGKAKTAVSFGAIFLALVLQGLKTGGTPADSPWLVTLLAPLTTWVMVAAVMLTIVSGVNYLAVYSGFSRTARLDQSAGGRLKHAPASENLAPK